MAQLEAAQWWLLEKEQPSGPFTAPYLIVRLQGGSLSPETRACPIGGSDWRPLRSWEPFAHAAALPVYDQAPQVAPRHAGNELPPMAKAICLYGLGILPAFWFVSYGCCLMSGPAFYEDSPLFLMELLITGAGLLLDSSAMVLLFIGALQLRKYRRLGVTLVVSGISIDLAWRVLAFLATMILFAAASANVDAIRPSDGTLDGIAGLFGLLSFAALVFEITSLVWILANRSRLPLH